MKKSVILIGMPGCGKSTIGVLLAKTLCLGFTDTDLVVQARERRPLQQILNESGLTYFLACEEAALLSLLPAQQVVATGGSAVLSAAAMEHLRHFGAPVFLDVPVPELERRIRNIQTRGIVLESGQTLQDLADIRRPLYLRYADYIVHAENADPETIVEDLASWYRHL